MENRIKQQMLASVPVFNATQKNDADFTELLGQCNHARDIKDYTNFIRFSYQTLNQAKFATKAYDAFLKSLPSINQASACKDIDPKTPDYIISLHEIVEQRKEFIRGSVSIVKLSIFAVVLLLRSKVTKTLDMKNTKRKIANTQVKLELHTAKTNEYLKGLKH